MNLGHQALLTLVRSNEPFDVDDPVLQDQISSVKCVPTPSRDPRPSPSLLP